MDEDLRELMRTFLVTEKLHRNLVAFEYEFDDNDKYRNPIERISIVFEKELEIEQKEK